MAGGSGRYSTEPATTGFGGVFSQATGFWWSIGMLVDLGGDDEYRGVYFAQGASAHFAIGSMIDHAGDDQCDDVFTCWGRPWVRRATGRSAPSWTSPVIDVYYIREDRPPAVDSSMGLFCDKTVECVR